MRLVAGTLAVFLSHSIALADEQAPPRMESKGADLDEATPERLPPSLRAKVPIRVVRILPETRQALLFDRTAGGTYLLVAVGERIGDYLVEAIDDDEVTLSANDKQVVLAAPDPSWRRGGGRTEQAIASAPASAAPMGAAAPNAAVMSAAPAGIAPASPVPASPVPASPVPASPVPASPVPASTAPASTAPASAAPASPAPEAAPTDPYGGPVPIPAATQAPSPTPVAAPAPAPTPTIDARPIDPYKSAMDSIEVPRGLPVDTNASAANPPATAPADPYAQDNGAPRVVRAPSWIEPAGEGSVRSTSAAALPAPSEATAPAEGALIDEQRPATLYGSSPAAGDGTSAATAAPATAAPAAATPAIAAPATAARASGAVTSPSQVADAPTPAPSTVAPSAPAPSAPAPSAVAPSAPSAAAPSAPAPSTGATAHAGEPVLTRHELDAALADFGALTNAFRGSFTSAGVQVDSVLDGSVFAKAGLRAGDVIASVDGKPLRSLNDVAALYARASTVRSVTAQVVRGGKPTTLRVSIQ